MRKTVLKFLVNTGLLLWGSVMAFSGLLLQIQYHIGNHGDINHSDTILGIDYLGWSLVHKISASVFFIFMISHIILHRKWYKAVLKKKLFAKNRQVLTLSAVFVLVAISGYIPWLIMFINGATPIRKTFIEIHDKIALILVVYLALHISKRLKWFINAFK